MSKGKRGQATAGCRVCERKGQGGSVRRQKTVRGQQMDRERTSRMVETAYAQSTGVNARVNDEVNNAVNARVNEGVKKGAKAQRNEAVSFWLLAVSSQKTEAGRQRTEARKKKTVNSERKGVNTREVVAQVEGPQAFAENRQASTTRSTTASTDWSTSGSTEVRHKSLRGTKMSNASSVERRFSLRRLRRREGRLARVRFLLLHGDRDLAEACQARHKVEQSAPAGWY